MNTTKVTLSAVLGLVILTSSASAQRGAMPVTPRSVPTNTSAPADLSGPCLPAEPVSSVHGKATLLQSHIRSLGTIGSNIEVVVVKVRGLDTPNMVQVVYFNRETGQMMVPGVATAPGLGVAIVNGAAQVGGNFLFGSNIKPDQQNINNGSASVSEGSTAVSLSKGGNATGGNATSLSGANSTSKSGALANSTSNAKSQNQNTSVNVNDNQNKNSSVNNNANNNSNKNNNNNKSGSAGNTTYQSQSQGQWQDQGQWQQNSQQNFPKY